MGLGVALAARRGHGGPRRSIETPRGSTTRAGERETLRGARRGSIGGGGAPTTTTTCGSGGTHCSMSRRMRISSFLTKLIATPLRPKRPERPAVGGGWGGWPRERRAKEATVFIYSARPRACIHAVVPRRRSERPSRRRDERRPPRGRAPLIAATDRCGGCRARGCWAGRSR